MADRPYADRPYNVRTGVLERGYPTTNRHHIPEARGEEQRTANLPYRGHHRAGSKHLADEQTPAQRRSSRVGKHHADPADDVTYRW